MQLFLSLRGQDVALPMAYRPLIQGMIYRALAEHDSPELAAMLHDVGYAGDGRAFKLFTFGPLNGPYIPMGREIRFQNWMRLEIRSPQPDFIRRLARCFPEKGILRLGDNELQVSSAKLRYAHSIGACARVEMVSPLIAYITDPDRHTNFLAPDDDAFYRAIVRNAERKWAAFRGSSAPIQLEVAPLPGQSWRREVTSFKGTYLTGWYGCFELRGAPEVLDFLYQAGLGAKNSQGFGMFRPIDYRRANQRSKSRDPIPDDIS